MEDETAVFRMDNGRYTVMHVFSTPEEWRAGSRRYFMQFSTESKSADEMSLLSARPLQYLVEMEYQTSNRSFHRIEGEDFLSSIDWIRERGVPFSLTAAAPGSSNYCVGFDDPKTAIEFKLRWR